MQIIHQMYGLFLCLRELYRVEAFRQGVLCVRDIGGNQLLTGCQLGFRHGERLEKGQRSMRTRCSLYVPSSAPDLCSGPNLTFSSYLVPSVTRSPSSRPLPCPAAPGSASGLPSRCTFGPRQPITSEFDVFYSCLLYTSPSPRD